MPAVFSAIRQTYYVTQKLLYFQALVHPSSQLSSKPSSQQSNQRSSQSSNVGQDLNQKSNLQVNHPVNHLVYLQDSQDLKAEANLLVQPAYNLSRSASFHTQPSSQQMPSV